MRTKILPAILKNKLLSYRGLFLLLSFCSTFVAASHFKPTTIITKAVLNDMCQSDGFVTLGNIVIEEEMPDDFGTITSNQFLIATLPAGFEFEAGQGTLSFESKANLTDPWTPGGGNLSNPQIWVTNNQLIANYQVSGDALYDRLIISGLRVRVLTGGASGSITISPASSIQINAVTAGAALADLSSNPTPAASAIATNFTYCQGDNLATASINSGDGVDTDLLWYDNSSLIGSPVVTGTTFNANALASLGLNSSNIGTLRLYVARRNTTTGCRTLTAKAVDFTINGRPFVSLSSSLGNTFCSNQNTTLTALGNGLEYRFIRVSDNFVLRDWSADNTFNPTLPVGATSVRVESRFSAANTCIATATIALTVNASPVVNYVNPSETSFPVTQNTPVPLSNVDDPMALPPTPFGGQLGGNFIARNDPNATYSGPGVVFRPLTSTYVFFPNAAGEGAHTITFTYTTAQGCVASTTTTFTVFDPSAILTGTNISPDNRYCQNSPAVTNLQPGAFFPPGYTAFNIVEESSPSGFLTGGPGSYVFNPAHASTLGFSTPVIVRLRCTVTAPYFRVAFVEFIVNPLPNVNYSGIVNNQNVCINQTIPNLIASVDGNDIPSAQATYQVSFDNSNFVNFPDVFTGGNMVVSALAGKTIGATTFPATLNAPFEVWVRVRATEPTTGCVNVSPSRRLVVNPLPDLTFTGITAGQSICVNNLPITLEARNRGVLIGNGTFEISTSSTGPFSAYSAVNAAGQSSLVPGVGVLATPGNYWLRVRHNDANGCSSESAAIAFEIEPLPTVAFTGINTDGYCANSASFTLLPNVITNDGGPFVAGSGRFFISKDGGAFAAQPFGQNNFNPATIGGAGSYQVFYQYTNTNGCVNNSSTQSFTVFPLPTLSFTGLAAEYCNNELPATLTPLVNGAPVGSGFSFELSSNGGASYGASPALTGSSFNPSHPSLSPGNYLIRVRYTQSFGATSCVSTSAGVAVTIKAAPTANISFPNNGLTFNTCLNNPPVLMNAVVNGVDLYATASPDIPNGTFSFKRVTDPESAYQSLGAGARTLNPASLGVGSFNIRYIFTATNGCQVTAPLGTLNINPVPNLTIEDLAIRYCEDIGSTTIRPLVNGSAPTLFSAANRVVITTPSNATINIPLNNPSGTATLNITAIRAAHGVGLYRAVFEYTDGASCQNVSTERSFNIFPLPVVSLFVPSTSGPTIQYCQNNAPITLSVSPVGGTFQIRRISAPVTAFEPLATNVFNPQQPLPSEPVSEPGQYVIRYTFTDINGCQSFEDSPPITINPIPIINTLTINELCLGDATHFNVSVTETNTTGWTWFWSFGDGVTSTLQNPSHTYAALGSYIVTLRITTNLGCTIETTRSITISPRPVAAFQAIGFCGGPGTSTRFVNNSSVVSPSNIVSVLWNFGDGITSTDANADVLHTYINPGTYTVSLTVVTNAGCDNTVSQQVNIFPSFTPTPDIPYASNFNVNNGFWIAGFDAGNNSPNPLPSWRYGPANGFNINFPENVWITNGNGNTYSNNERSFLESPCFDLSNLDKPMLSMRYWVDAENGIDGVNISYKVNDGTPSEQPWQLLGVVGVGLNWYNNSGITSLPGSFLQGWSGQQGEWREAKINLNNIKNQIIPGGTVRFRINFSSNADNPIGVNFDGFAMSEFRVFERSRLVLLEHFTNTGSIEANTENSNINNFVTSNSTEIVDIQYHTSFPSTTDPMNVVNPADPSGRALYYGISQVPRTVSDGVLLPQRFSAISPIPSTPPLTVGDVAFRRRVLEESPFRINVSFPPSTDGRLNISAVVEATQPFDSTVIVQIAVIEEEINGILFTGQSLAGLNFRHVVKKLLPDAAGTRVVENWLPGTQVVVNQSWRIENTFDNSRLAVVVFVQNDATRYIHQAHLAKPATPPSGGVTSIGQDISSQLLLYPNPAGNEVYVAFRSLQHQGFDYQIYDAMGKATARGQIAPNDELLRIDTSTWAEGMYLIRMSDKNGRNAYKKIVIER